jgi:hypothetical protein
VYVWLYPRFSGSISDRLRSKRDKLASKFVTTVLQHVQQSAPFLESRGSGGGGGRGAGAGAGRSGADAALATWGAVSPAMVDMHRLIVVRAVTVCKVRLSRPVVSCRVLSCPVVSCRVLSCPVVPCDAATKCCKLIDAHVSQQAFLDFFQPSAVEEPKLSVRVVLHVAEMPVTANIAVSAVSGTVGTVRALAAEVASLRASDVELRLCVDEDPRSAANVVLDNDMRCVVAAATHRRSTCGHDYGCRCRDGGTVVVVVCVRVCVQPGVGSQAD